MKAFFILVYVGQVKGDGGSSS